MIRLFIFSLMVWSLGGLGLLLVALSDLAFSKSFKAFPKRLALILVWPLALFSARGRAALWHVTRETQELSK
jgi:hypothetical protein